MRFTVSTGMAKPTPAEGPRRRRDRRVDADQAPGAVDERAAGVARIDRRVGLDDPGHLARRQVGSLRSSAADHPGREAARGRTGCRSRTPLADLEVGRAAHWDRAHVVGNASRRSTARSCPRRRADELRRDSLPRRQAYPISSAPATTWLLVTIWPARSHTKPEPVPAAAACSRSAAARVDRDDRRRRLREELRGVLLRAREIASLHDRTRLGGGVQVCPQVALADKRGAEHERQHRHHAPELLPRTGPLHAAHSASTRGKRQTRPSVQIGRAGGAREQRGHTGKFWSRIAAAGARQVLPQPIASATRGSP